MIDLVTEKIIFVIKIIHLDTKIFIKKIIIVFIFKIDSNNIYMAIALIN